MKVNTPPPSAPYHLHIGGPQFEGTGQPVAAPPQTRAWLELGSTVTLSVALPHHSATEDRWLVDQVFRAATKLVKPKGIKFEPVELSSDLTRTLALDVWARADGELEIDDSHQPADIHRLATFIKLYKDWVNDDPEFRTSLRIAQDVQSWAAERDAVKTWVMQPAGMQQEGLQLLLAVGAGAERSPPQLVMAEYRPEGCKDDEKPLMLVGKGITFDTGGINVKPYESFVSMMKNDMGGAALAFSLFKGLVEQGYDKPVVLAIPTCENGIDAKAMKPGALVTGHRGIEVRIDHTDAEGRLVLADALSYCTERFEPDDVWCFATLTTAALIAYGPYATPVHFASSELEARLAEAASRTGEDLHFFPERVWHRQANLDQEAELKNTGRLPGNASKGAGSRNAAHFLKFFTDAPLTHFDIFASTWNWSGEAPAAGYGATGAPLRTLLEALMPADK